MKSQLFRGSEYFDPPYSGNFGRNNWKIHGTIKRLSKVNAIQQTDMPYGGQWFRSRRRLCKMQNYLRIIYNHSYIEGLVQLKQG